MDREWMRQRLEHYKALCDAYDGEIKQSGQHYTQYADRLYAQVNGEIPSVKEIVKRLDPSLVETASTPWRGYTTSTATGAIDQALGILRDQDEWKTRLAPDAPSLIADQFHPNVWTAAAAIWDTGQYRVAVQQAAVSLSAHIAAKAVSSLTDRELVQLVFKPDAPAQGQTRLHFPGDKTTRNWRSQQDGLHLMAQGAFAGIRNVATHTDVEWTEQVALEHLAVLSVVARWTDETELVKLRPKRSRRVTWRLARRRSSWRSSSRPASARKGSRRAGGAALASRTCRPRR
jgi:hypothetical protein